MTTQAWAGSLILWEVTGGRVPVWLYGSVHVCNARCFPLPPAVESHFEQADSVAVELDATNPALLIKVAALMQGDGDVREHLSEAEWRSIVALLGGAGMDEAKLARLNPPILAMQLSMAVAQKMKLSPAYGTDLQLITRARKAGKPLVELETIERQMQALNAGTPAEQLASLRYTLRAVKDGSLRKWLQEAVDAWQASNARKLASAMRRAELADPSGQRAAVELFTVRNREMSETISKLAQQDKSVFVVVGCGHLVGPGSIPAILAKKGLKVRQLSTAD